MGHVTIYLFIFIEWIYSIQLKDTAVIFCRRNLKSLAPFSLHPCFRHLKNPGRDLEVLEGTSKDHHVQPSMGEGSLDEIVLIVKKVFLKYAGKIPLSLLFSRLSSPSSQPLLTGEMLLSLHHPHGPLLDSLHQLQAFQSHYKAFRHLQGIWKSRNLGTSPYCSASWSAKAGRSVQMTKKRKTFWAVLLLTSIYVHLSSYCRIAPVCNGVIFLCGKIFHFQGFVRL